MTGGPLRGDASLNFDLGIDDVETHLARTRQFTVGDLLQTNARARPEATAIVGEDDASLTWGALDERVNRLANALADRGLGYGSTVAIVSENRPEFTEVVFAGAKLGALVPTQNWRLGRRELLHCLEITDPDLVVVSKKHADKAEWIASDDALNVDVVGVGGADVGIDYESLVESGDPTEPELSREPTPEDGAVVLYTSGTTGLPKGAVISHRALLTRGMLWTRSLDMKHHPDFVGWNPMFHMGGMELLMAVVLNGGTHYPVDSFDLDVVLDRQRRANASYLIVFPSTVDPIVEYAETRDWDPDEYGLEVVGVMADLYAPETIERVTELFDADFLNSFGATETGLGPCSDDVIPGGAREGSVDLGKAESPLYDVRLVDEDGDDVPPGDVGEIACRGPALFSGYIDNPDANESDFVDGWFRLGDLFYRDDDGDLHYVDRRKYLIKSGGENVYPAEIEQVLLDHPDVAEVCVVRVPDEKWGEVPMAYVAAADDADVSADDVLDFLDGEIARYKLPHYVEFVSRDTFEHSTTGKIQRGPLEDREITVDRVRNPGSD